MKKKKIFFFFFFFFYKFPKLSNLCLCFFFFSPLPSFPFPPLQIRLPPGYKELTEQSEGGIDTIAIYWKSPPFSFVDSLFHYSVAVIGPPAIYFWAPDFKSNVILPGGCNKSTVLWRDNI